MLGEAVALLDRPQVTQSLVAVEGAGSVEKLAEEVLLARD
jgi:hypothetical protein